eukprot:SAG31_NODE_86_length_26973_cov_16.850897_21_plen_270_part_00
MALNPPCTGSTPNVFPVRSELYCQEVCELVPRPTGKLACTPKCAFLFYFLTWLTGGALHTAPPRDGVQGTGRVRSQVLWQGTTPRCSLALPMVVTTGCERWQGELHVSTIRMVFVCSSPSADFGAFDIPLANIADESFNQPIFGANNLSGKVQAIANSAAGVTGAIQFKLYFNEGGCATFLRAFFSSMEEIRRIPTAVPVASEFTQAAVSGAFAQAAFVDPSDPSTVYVSQASSRSQLNILSMSCESLTKLHSAGYTQWFAAGSAGSPD